MPNEYTQLKWAPYAKEEDRNTGYMPREVPGRQALLALVRKEAHDHLLSCRSKVEGIQFQIKKLAKASAA